MNSPLRHALVFAALGGCEWLARNHQSHDLSVEEVASRVTRSVVNIVSANATAVRRAREMLGTAGTAALPYSVELRGSGFFIDAEGRILTSRHVIESEGLEVRVQLHDGRELPAAVIGEDASSDLALLRVRSGTTGKLPPPLPLGDSDRVRIGQSVIAVGSPFGLGHSITLGIVSGKYRKVSSDTWMRFLQTDAAINPGNSGGPLCNLRGEVVGINTAIPLDANRVGFATPSNSARLVLPALHQSWIGVVPDDSAEGEGVLLAEVVADSPAAKADVRVGDTILNVNGAPVRSRGDLAAAIKRITVGKRLVLGVRRNGYSRSISVVTTERD